MTDGMRLTARVVEVTPEIVSAREALEAVQQAEQARRDLEAALGELDRGREQVGPWQPAMLAMRELEHAQRAGHSDGEPAGTHARERLRPPVRAEEHVLRRRHGSGFAALVSRDGAGATF